MEAERYNIWSLRTICLITGASRGLGQTMAVRFAENMRGNSVMVIAARDGVGLQTTKKSIQQLRSDIVVHCWVVDLSELNAKVAEECFKQILTQLNVSPVDFEQALMVHNAASMGDISSLFTEQHDGDHLNYYWRLNLTSAIILNSVFWKMLDISTIRQKIVISITSICAKQAFRSWSIYCSGKAARDMMFQTMALEQPHIRVLNYAPGPLDTEMQVEARTKTADSELRNMFQTLHAEGRLLTCDQSVDRLISILEENRFDSGVHIDYYDDDY